MAILNFRILKSINAIKEERVSDILCRVARNPQFNRSFGAILIVHREVAADQSVSIPREIENNIKTDMKHQESDEEGINNPKERNVYCTNQPESKDCPRVPIFDRMKNVRHKRFLRTPPIKRESSLACQAVQRASL